LNRILDSKEISITKATLKTYLHSYKKSGLIYSAGRGWFSSIEKPFKLNQDPIKAVEQILKDKMPLLSFSCWSTEQLNSYTHHILSKFIIFVNTDSDFINNTAEVLEKAGYIVYKNPTKNEIGKFFKNTGKTVVLLPSISKEPKATDGYAPIEKILVDFLMENRNFFIMEASEADNTVGNAILSGRINISLFLDYSKRRKFNIKINQLIPPKQ